MADAALGQVPFSASQSAQRGRTAIGSDIAGYPVCLVNRDVEDIVVLIGNGEIFALDAFDVGGMQPDELPDAVVHMDNPVAWLQIRVDCLRCFSA